MASINSHGMGEQLAETAVEQTRARIIDAAPHLAAPEYRNEWWLLGTTGCHLCEVAEHLITRLQAVEPITYRHVDIADFDEALMMEFATIIPVVITQTQRLNYPFSVMDLQRLL